MGANVPPGLHSISDSLSVSLYPLSSPVKLFSSTASLLDGTSRRSAETETSCTVVWLGSESQPVLVSDPVHRYVRCLLDFAKRLLMEYVREGCQATTANLFQTVVWGGGVFCHNLLLMLCRCHHNLLLRLVTTFPCAPLPCPYFAPSLHHSVCTVLLFLYGRLAVPCM